MKKKYNFQSSRITRELGLKKPASEVRCGGSKVLKTSRNTMLAIAMIVETQLKRWFLKRKNATVDG